VLGKAAAVLSPKMTLAERGSELIGGRPRLAHMERWGYGVRSRMATSFGVRICALHAVHVQRSRNRGLEVFHQLRAAES
jgi:hypothetical protein